MLEFANQPVIQATLAVAVVVALACVGYQIVTRLRPTTSKPDTNAAALSQNFEEMQLEGYIDGAELRKIKSVLGKSHASRTEGQLPADRSFGDP